LIAQFEPTKRHGLDLSQHMSKKIAGSLVHITQQVCEAANTTNLSSEVHKRLMGCGQTVSRFSPALFLLHDELLKHAILNDIIHCQRLIGEIVSRDWSAEKNLKICNFSINDLGKTGYRRFKESLLADPTTELIVEAPNAQASSHMSCTIRRAMEILHHCDRDQFEEIEVVLAEIVLAKCNTTDGLELNGATSFLSWGAILLNADQHRDVLDIVQAIVHEEAHLVLFAEAIDGPLVLNDHNVTFTSPLRSDPRPMDGLFHATYVLARMYRSALKIYANGKDFSETTALTKDVVETIKTSFDDGYKVVVDHGQLTPLGKVLISQAADFVTSVAD
jgi:hypothetical protein